MSRDPKKDRRRRKRLRLRNERWMRRRDEGRMRILGRLAIAVLLDEHMNAELPGLPLANLVKNHPAIARHVQTAMMIDVVMSDDDFRKRLDEHERRKAEEPA